MIVRDGKFHLIDTCKSAGLGPKEERDGSAEYYLSEPISEDNAHGVATCMMAYAEWRKCKEMR